MAKPLEAALVGKAGEALVAAELLRQHIDVAYPAFDGGVDLIAYRGHAFNRVVPIQVKARSQTCFHFQKAWFDISRIVLIQVWYVIKTPRFFLFSNLAEVEQALGPHAQTDSWKIKDRYNVTNPTDEQIDRMKPFENKWEKITRALD